MAAIKSLTVTVRMETGELRAGLELRAVTEEDEYDLAEMVSIAEEHGRYDDETKVLEFNGLGSHNLYWRGIGVNDRGAFENIPRGNWATSKWRVLYMSNPCSDEVESDDLSETCLCQDDRSCQTCRLQKKVKILQFELLEAQSTNEDHFERLEGLLEIIEKYEAKGSGVGRDGSDLEDAENEGEDHPALEIALRRAQAAELENRSLFSVIARLKRENKGLQSKASKPQNTSSSPMTEMTGSTQERLSVNDTSDDSYSDSDHLQYRRGGKTRPGCAENSGAHPVERVRGLTDQKTARKIGHAKATNDPKKMAQKRRRVTSTELEVEDEDEDEEPPFKRQRSTVAAPGKAVEHLKGPRKTRVNSCGPEKSAKKKQQDSSDDSDTESPIPAPRDRRSGFSHIAGRTPQAPKANQGATKSGRRTNNSQACVLDAIELSPPTSNSRNNLSALGSIKAASNTLSAFMGDESDTAIPNTPRDTSSIAAITANALNDTTTANPAHTATTFTASATISPTQTVNALAASVATNPTQPAPTSRRAQGWTNPELQVLIDLVGAHRNAPVGQSGRRPEVLHDVRLFELMSRQLQARGIHRSASACKNEWNRRGRQVSGIDNRKIANPSQMATSLQ